MQRDIKINGEICSVDDELSVLEFLLSRGLSPDAVVVECDRVIIAREEFESTRMSGQSYEIVQFVGGG